MLKLSENPVILIMESAKWGNIEDKKTTGYPLHGADGVPQLIIYIHASVLYLVLLQNYSEGMEMAFSGNFYAAIGNRSSMN